MPPSRRSASALSLAMGSSLTLPLVITRGRPTSRSSTWWSGVYGSIAPRYLRPGATAADTGEPSRHLMSTMGHCGEVSSRSSSAVTRQCLLTSSMVDTITARGLYGRRFRSRRRRTASSLWASHAR